MLEALREGALLVEYNDGSCFFFWRASRSVLLYVDGWFSCNIWANTFVPLNLGRIKENIFQAVQGAQPFGDCALLGRIDQIGAHTWSCVKLVGVQLGIHR